MNKMRGVASVHRLSARISPRYGDFWKRREHARKMADMMLPMWEAFGKELKTLDRKFSDFRVPDAKIGGTLNIRNPIQHEI